MKKDNKKVVYWLLTGCVLIFIMVVVGGITRLTHSGLSISNYKLISGAIPPITQAEWEAAFELYKQYPEYKLKHYDFTLEEFKGIYFWEWLHRFIGRLIGLVFIIPFIYFLLKKQLTNSTIKKSIILLIMGGFQGFLGWYMVKSGLVDRPDVSHYRLAAHLTTAFITFAYTYWVILDILHPVKKKVNQRFKRLVQFSFVVLIIQIVYGAFVAGLDAGFIHNTWPMMSEGKLLHESATSLDPPYINLIENPSGVQFVHRTFAFVVAILIFLLWNRSRKMNLTPNQELGIKYLNIILILQFALGVFTLLLAVPVWLGVAHQVGAFFLLTAMTFVLHRFSK